MRKNLFKTLAAASLAMASQTVPHASASTLELSGNVITGVLGVDVGGTLYDVTFADGSAVNLEPFTFTTQAAADAASNALLTEVFSTGSADVINGCTPTYSSTATCAIATLAARRLTSHSQGPGNVYASILVLKYDGSSSSVTDNVVPSVIGSAFRSTFADWQAEPVPEPGSAALAATGLAAVAAAAAKRRGKRRV